MSATHSYYQLFTHTMPRYCWRCGANMLGPGVGYYVVYAPLNSLQLCLCADCAHKFCEIGCEVAYAQSTVLAGSKGKVIYAWRILVELTIKQK